MLARSFEVVLKGIYHRTRDTVSFMYISLDRTSPRRYYHTARRQALRQNYVIRRLRRSGARRKLPCRGAFGKIKFRNSLLLTAYTRGLVSLYGQPFNLYTGIDSLKVSRSPVFPITRRVPLSGALDIVFVVIRWFPTSGNLSKIYKHLMQRKLTFHSIHHLAAPLCHSRWIRNSPASNRNSCRTHRISSSDNPRANLWFPQSNQDACDAGRLTRFSLIAHYQENNLDRTSLLRISVYIRQHFYSRVINMKEIYTKYSDFILLPTYRIIDLFLKIPEICFFRVTYFSSILRHHNVSSLMRYLIR